MNLPTRPPKDLIARHDRPGPRYTSYPTADRFTFEVGPAQYEAALERASQRPGAPLSIYVHLPFCEHLCLYCGCNVVITRNPKKLDDYLDRLLKEVGMVAERLGERQRVAQLHLGGGTPNYYTVSQLWRLLAEIRLRFEVAEDAEVAIEIDPRHSSRDQLRYLSKLGFNRLSMGIQDFDPRVQEGIGRWQPFEDVSRLVGDARGEGFESINFDLIYGLPHQSRDRFAATIEKVCTLSPDRLAVYSFAYLPWLRKQQNRLDSEAMLEGQPKLDLFLDARDALIGAGYVPIGLDHFAKPEDELAEAREAGTLRRNFQGYTVSDDLETVAFGMTAIGDVGGAYVQNRKQLKDYYAAIDADQLATVRGYACTRDDIARRYVIHELMCNFRLRRDALEDRFGLELERDFGPAMADLSSLTQDGLVVVDDEGIHVTQAGEFFVRVVAMAFDRHLREAAPRAQAYSRTV